jgi:hypothetical protein
MDFTTFVIVVVALIVLSAVVQVIMENPLTAIAIVTSISFAIFILFKVMDNADKKKERLWEEARKKRKLELAEKEKAQKELEDQEQLIEDNLIKESEKQLVKIGKEIDDISGDVFHELRNISNNILSEIVRDCRFISCPRCREGLFLNFNGIDEQEQLLKMQCRSCEKVYNAEISKCHDPIAFAALIKDHRSAYMAKRPILMDKIAKRDSLLDNIHSDDWEDFSLSLKYGDIYDKLDSNIDFYSWTLDGVYLDIDWTSNLCDLVDTVFSELIDKLNKTEFAQSAGGEKFSVVDDIEISDMAIELNSFEFKRENGEVFMVSWDELRESVKKIISNIKLLDGDNSKILRSSHEKYKNDAIIAVLRLLRPEAYLQGYDK